MSVLALWLVKSSCLANLPLAGGLLVGLSVAAVLVAIRAAVEEKGSPKDAPAPRVFEAPGLAVRTRLADAQGLSARGERSSKERA